MSSLITVLVTLHVGMLTVPPARPWLPFREEARIAAAQLVAPPSPPGIATLTRTATDAGPTAWSVAGSRVGAELVPLRRDEWVGLFVHRFDGGASRIVHAAAWLASIPVQLDVRPGRFSMRVTLHTH